MGLDERLSGSGLGAATAMRNGPEERRRAVLAVCSEAADRAEAADLLEMLGLTPEEGLRVAAHVATASAAPRPSHG